MEELGGTPSGPRVLPQRSRLRSTAKRLGLDGEEGPRLVQREWGMSPNPCPTASRGKGPGRGECLSLAGSQGQSPLLRDREPLDAHELSRCGDEGSGSDVGFGSGNDGLDERTRVVGL
jgi:hypothetical protein